MYYSEAVREAARRANAAAKSAMSAYKDATIDYEKALTGGLTMALRDALNERIDGLDWTAHILRDSSGKGAEETAVGADLIIHVHFRSPEITYSKGILVQAKRIEPGEMMGKSAHEELVGQCKQMLSYTAASFVFDYAKYGMRCGAASAIATSNNRDLYEQCVWTPYRFFLELFRCPIGDPRIGSAKIRELPAPNKIEFMAEGRGELSRGG
jgi:hypothetical protein